MLCFSVVLWLRRFAKVAPKSEVVRRDGPPKMWTKFAPRLRERANRKSKSLKTGMIGALLQVDIDKICTTPARESDLEVKIVKNWRCRSSFGR